MKITPVNNWLHVELKTKQQEQDRVVLLPDDYRTAENPYSIVRIITSSTNYSAGDTLIVPTHTIQDIDVNGKTIHLVLQNHVLAVVE